jgi:transposase
VGSKKFSCFCQIGHIGPTLSPTITPPTSRQISMTKHHSTARKAAIVGMHLAGMPFVRIAEEMAVAPSTVRSIVKHYKLHTSVDTLPRTGRPASLTARDKRAAKRAVIGDRRAPLSAIAANLPKRVSKNTLRAAMHEMGFAWCVAPKKPFLNERHKAARLAFALAHRHWTRENWAKIM